MQALIGIADTGPAVAASESRTKIPSRRHSTRLSIRAARNHPGPDPESRERKQEKDGSTITRPWWVLMKSKSKDNATETSERAINSSSFFLSTDKETDTQQPTANSAPLSHHNGAVSVEYRVMSKRAKTRPAMSSIFSGHLGAWNQVRNDLPRTSTGEEGMMDTQRKASREGTTEMQASRELR